MKNLVAKLKGLNYKELALQYGERVGLGVVALIVGFCLFSTRWSAFAKAPGELETAATTAQQQVVSSVWPETQKTELKVVDFVDSWDKRSKGVEVVRYEYRHPMSPKLYPREEPVDEPKLEKIEELVATAGTFVMSTLPPGYADQLAATGENTTPSAVTATADPSSEFARRDATGATGAGAAPGIGSSAMPGGPVKGPAAGHEGGGASKKKSKSAAGSASALESSAFGSAGGEGYPGMAAMPTASGRGVRFVSVRGVFPMYEQLKKMQRALRLESLEQTAQMVDFVDFKVQRQRAVIGSDPWTGPWEDLDLQPAKDMLTNEAEDFDIDVVATEVTNYVFTMPLPKRVVGFWQPQQVSHPRLTEYLLTEEKMQQEMALNMAVAEAYDQMGNPIPQRTQAKGFATLQRNMSSMRSAVGSAMGAMGSSSDAGGGAMGNLRTMVGKFSSGNGAEGGGSALGSGMPGGGMGMQTQFSLGGLLPKMLLFRIFDVAIEPGECYRYRVQLEIRNPNYGLDVSQVKDPSVVEGETRLTEWSNASAPVVVPRDNDYFLKQIARTNAGGGPRRPVFPPTVELNMYQWDPETGTRVGTIVSNKADPTKRDVAVLRVSSGSYVGGKSKALRLNAVVPTLADEDVTFASKDILVDTSALPALDLALNPDLKLNSAAWAELSEKGKLDQMVIVNQYGELVALDGPSRVAEKNLAEQRLKAEQEPYKDLVGVDPNAPQNTGLEGFAAGSDAGGEGGGKGGAKKSKTKNPLRAMRGSGGS